MTFNYLIEKEIIKHVLTDQDSEISDEYSYPIDCTTTNTIDHDKVRTNSTDSIPELYYSVCT